LPIEAQFYNMGNKCYSTEKGDAVIPFYKKYSRTIFDIALLLLTVYLFMLLFSFLYGIAKPIFWGFVIFMLIEPFARFLHRRGLKKILATTISTMLLLLIVLAAVTILGVVFTKQVMGLFEILPGYITQIQDKVADIAAYLQTQISTLPSGIEDKAKEYSGDISSNVLKALKSMFDNLVTSLTTFSSTLIGIIVNLSMGLILAFFLSIEIDTWKRLAQAKTPSTFKKAFEFLRVNVIKGITSYIKSQLKLLSITFIIVFVSLLLLGVRNAFALSVLCAIIDVLPLLGVSAFFIPWITYALIVGDTTLGLWLIAILAVVVIVRQILEPKITGESLGVSAFTMLVFMVLSLSLFGVMGLIMSPVLIILIKALYDQGYLRRWIRLPEEEYPDLHPAEAAAEQGKGE